MNTLTFGAQTIDAGVVVAVVLAIVAIASMARILLGRARASDHARTAAPWRTALLILAQPILAALLYLALVPPTTPGEAGTLVVATAGATAADVGTGQGGDAIVALPEAPKLAGIERVPDLATALRRHPGMRRIRVVGAGLEARDRDAGRGYGVAFDAPALPRGLVELAAPAQATAGDAFVIHGRANDLRGGVAELLDPAGRRVDRIALQDDGAFALGATTRIPGDATFTLRLRDSRQRVVEDIALPLRVDAPVPPRVLLLAGAPGPEIKYLRRWARDAGVSMHARMAVGGGVQLGDDAAISMDTATLGRFDLVILDERAWSNLGESQRAALLSAMRNGLGVLLRVTAAPKTSERQRLRALGFNVEGGSDTLESYLSEPRRDSEALRARTGPGTRDQARKHDEQVPDAPALTRRTLRVTTTDGVALVRDREGQPIATWRAEGRGRIAVWPLTDTYRLVLAGRDDLFGETWSDAVATLARAQATRPFAIEGEARVGERLVFCGLARSARVTSADGKATAVSVDPKTGARACAAYWPRTPGWHRVTDTGRMQSFHVRASNEATGLHANLVRQQTLGLAAESTARASDATRTPPRHPGARWPWWLAWLSVAAALWWFERSRIGLKSG